MMKKNIAVWGSLSLLGDAVRHSRNTSGTKSGEIGYWLRKTHHQHKSVDLWMDIPLTIVLCSRVKLRLDSRGASRTVGCGKPDLVFD